MTDPESMLDRSLGTLSEVPPSRAVNSRIRAQCQPHQAVRTSTRTWRLFATLVALLGGVFLYLTSVRYMQHVEPAGWVRVGLLALGGWSVAFAAVLWVGVYRFPGRRVPRRTRRFLIVGLLSALFAYLSWLAKGFSPLAVQLAPAGLSSLLRCAMSVAWGGAVIAAFMMALWRRTDPFDPGITGALLGLLAGLATALALGEVCSNQEAWHLWLGHGVAVLLVTCLSALVGRRWLSP